MGVFIEPGERAGESKITFVARRKTPTQAYAALNEVAFHKKFAELVDLIAKIAPTPALQQALMVDNPQRLYRFAATR